MLSKRIQRMITLLRKNFKRLLLRHVTVLFIALVLTLPFWWGRLNWDPEMRLWRAIGDSSFLLLVFTLTIGPLARLWPTINPLVAWRREAGIWYGLLALVHTVLIFAGWARWDILRFLGYEYVPQLERYARIEPGFGLANLMGLIAMAITLLLVGTSANWALNRLGASAWKWLQYGAYSVFYLVVLHTAYFLFMHYTVSFHRSVPDELNWFSYPFLTLAISVPILQTLAFFKTVRRQSETSK